MYHFSNLSKLHALDIVIPKNQKITLVNQCYKRISVILEWCDLQSCSSLFYVDLNGERKVLKEYPTRVKLKPVCRKIHKVAQISFPAKRESGISSYILFVKLLLSNVYLFIGTFFAYPGTVLILRIILVTSFQKAYQ
jgi:hypothetical protein